MTRDQEGFAVQIETDSFHLYYRGGEFNGANLFIEYKYNFRRTIRVGITVIPMSRTCLERPER